jgi:hypothetical protein
VPPSATWHLKYFPDRKVQSKVEGPKSKAKRRIHHTLRLCSGQGVKEELATRGTRSTKKEKKDFYRKIQPSLELWRDKPGSPERLNRR